MLEKIAFLKLRNSTQKLKKFLINLYTLTILIMVTTAKWNPWFPLKYVTVAIAHERDVTFIVIEQCSRKHISLYTSI